MTFPSQHAATHAAINPTPTVQGDRPRARALKAVPKEATCIGYAVTADGEVPSELGLDRPALVAAGFEGKIGDALVIPRKGGPSLVAVGIGDPTQIDASQLRDAAAAFARTSTRHEILALSIFDQGFKEGALSAVEAAQALVEGVLLARYRYRPLRHPPESERVLKEIAIVAPSAALESVQQGVERGLITSYAAMLARDLANAPATIMTARKMTEVATELAPRCGLEIEVFDEEQLLAMGCGGMLGVNAGSAEPPRLIKLSYVPRDKKGKAIEPAGRISLVGKGIMFDAGGIGLKPNDLVHASMKTDMSGAAAILGCMSALAALDAKAAVTAYLMCTDNMPDGSAMKPGDVLTARGGKTIEVLNTDAEGRLVLADGLVLATEEDPKPDAIVDIATLTGACQRALGSSSAGVIGNHQGLVDQVKASADRSDETVWQLPLDRRYRKELDSEIADLKNIGGENAGAITAALFLDEFVGGLPWAHIDMAGTSKVDVDEDWLPRGATGYGTRLLIEFVTGFIPPEERAH